MLIVHHLADMLADFIDPFALVENRLCISDGSKATGYMLRDNPSIRF